MTKEPLSVKLLNLNEPFDSITKGKPYNNYMIYIDIGRGERFIQTGKIITHYLTQEIRESCNRMFLLSIIGILGCLVLDNAHAMTLLLRNDIAGIDVLYYLKFSLNHGFYGMFVIPLMAALPYGLCYYRDVRAGITRSVISKTGIKVYCVGKMISTFLSGFLSCACSLGLFSAFICCYRPLFDREVIAEWMGMPFDRLLISGQYMQYLWIRFLLYGVWCGIWCLFALCISSYVQNAYVILASVTVILFGWNTIYNVLDINVAYRPSGWFSCSAGLGSDTVIVVSCILFTLFMLGLSWVIFYRKVRQNLYTG